MNTKNSPAEVSAKSRNPVMHHRGTSQYPGDFQITDQALKNYKVCRELFGTTEVKNLDGSTYIVRDYQYTLDDGSVGMLFLPVDDFNTIRDGEIQQAFGSALVDDYLRDKMELQPGDPIYAPIYYIHPERCRGTLTELADEKKCDKLQMGITHWGSYLGCGRTSNAPALYHNRVWGVEGEADKPYGYPANVMIMSLDGVDQAKLNKNMLLADNFLNYGVRFPENYVNSKFRTANLNTIFMFYRDWILGKEYLRRDVDWFTFCAAHKTIVATIGMNLPHNPAAFEEVYGPTEGKLFFAAFCDLHYTVTGIKFTKELETDFEPLWKKSGLTSEQIRPLTLDEYMAYDSAYRNATLKTYEGFKPLPPGVGMPWGATSTSDIIYNFVQNYGDLIDAGALVMSLTIFGFSKATMERSGISEVEYLRAALPIIQSAFDADARVRAAATRCESFELSDYYKETFLALYYALGGTDKNIDPCAKPDFEQTITGFFETNYAVPEQSSSPQLSAWLSLMHVRQNWTSIMSEPQLTKNEAYDYFMESIRLELKAQRDLVATRADRIQYNVPPPLAHNIGIGMFPKSEFVSLKTVLTVMHHTELEQVATDS